MSNNHSSFAQIYEQYADMVYNVCLGYLQNSENAEDVMQNTFIKVHEKLDSFEQKSSLKTWIYRIAINQSLDFIKAQNTGKRKGIMVSIFGNKEGEKSYEPADFDHPGVQLEDKEAYSSLMQKINTLPANQKTALLLKTTENLSINEISEVMEMKNKAVNSLLVRARQNLSKKIEVDRSAKTKSSSK